MTAWLSCKGARNSAHVPDVPEDFTEQVVLARVTADFEWVYDNMYTYHPSTRSSRPSDNAAMSDTQREHVRELLRGNCDYEIEYAGNRARLVIDISQSGFVEWFNVNVIGRPADYWASSYDASYKHRLEYLLYEDGRWWIDAMGPLFFGPPPTPEESQGG